MKYTVRLSNETIGTINSDTLNGQSAHDFIGKKVNVRLHDENGNPIEQEGILIEVLESSVIAKEVIIPSRPA
jgi:hypothetical protein